MKYKIFSLFALLFFFGIAIANIPGAEFAVAIESGDLEAIKALIQGGAAADTIIDYGEHKITPLMKAAWDGELEIAQYLIDSGADVNAVDDQKETALFSAVKRDRVEIAQLLIDRGAKVNVKDSREFTPLIAAAAAGNPEIIKILVKAGGNIKEEMFGLTPLMFAVASKKAEIVKLLVGLGAPVDQVSSLSGQTALLSAIYAGSAEMVQTLVDLKANVNFRTKDGDTPLKAAGKGDQTDLIEILKAAGAKK
jgi:ankyrin repeat protein